MVPGQPGPPIGLETMPAAPRSIAVVVDDPGLDPMQRLLAVFDRLGVWDDLEARARTTGHDPADLPIVIVPELGAFASGSPAATDPALVEALVDVLHDHGFTSVVVAGGADGSERWAANRSVYALTDLLGYRFVTPAGCEYDIVDLSEQLQPSPFGPGDVLAGTALNSWWLDAGYRIVFATNITDEVAGYALALHTTLRVLPDGVPGGGADAVAEVLRATPVHLALIDGIVSGHGSGGRRAPRPISTDCLIAASDPWLADAVGALKMGLDPGVSPLAVRSPWLDGAVAGAVIRGSLDTYAGWTSPHPLVLESARRRSASWWWSQLLQPWLQVLDSERFPLESPLDARMNERLAPWFARIDDDDIALAALVLINTMAGWFQQSIDGYRVLFDKDRLPRVEASLGFDAERRSDEEYTAIEPELQGLWRLLEGTEERRPGLRWRYFDGAVLFDYRRELPIEFDQFVATVDVSRAISYMNDYIGGVVVVVTRDESGRPRRQAERNLYLPQPNYLVLSGGQPIDVSKLEVVSYHEDRHTLHWKTIASENDSAVHDDGVVRFERTVRGTSVTIFGRQLFVLPPLWQSIDRAINTELREQLVTDAYDTFFGRTLANLEAIVEGRDIRIGRPATATSDAPLPSAVVEQLIENAIDWLGTLRPAQDRAAPPRSGPKVAPGIDADGFIHFAAAPAVDVPNGQLTPVVTGVAEFWSGLFQATLRDLADVVVGAER